MYGNTEKIAQAIGQVLAEKGSLQVVKVGEVQASQLAGIDLLVVGSPTQQFRATEKMRQWLDDLPVNGLEGVRTAVCDTRLTTSFINQNRVLAFFEKFGGYAAEKLGKAVTRKGARLVGPAQAFYVQGMEGPLVEGELERASEWAGKLFA